jgi:hypothetical protein
VNNNNNHCQNIKQSPTLYFDSSSNISHKTTYPRGQFKQRVIQIAISSLDSIFNVWQELKSPYWRACSTYITVFSIRLCTQAMIYSQTCFKHTTQTINWVADIMQWSTEVFHGLPWQNSQLKQTVTSPFITSAYFTCSTFPTLSALQGYHGHYQSLWHFASVVPTSKIHSSAMLFIQIVRNYVYEFGVATNGITITSKFVIICPAVLQLKHAHVWTFMFIATYNLFCILCKEGIIT